MPENLIAAQGTKDIIARGWRNPEAGALGIDTVPSTGTYTIYDDGCRRVDICCWQDREKVCSWNIDLLFVSAGRRILRTVRTFVNVAGLMELRSKAVGWIRALLNAYSPTDDEMRLILAQREMYESVVISHIESLASEKLGGRGPAVFHSWTDIPGTGFWESAAFFWDGRECTWRADTDTVSPVGIV